MHFKLCLCFCLLISSKEKNMPPKGCQYSVPLEIVFQDIYYLTDILVLISVLWKLLDVTSPWEITYLRKLMVFTFQKDKTMAGHRLQGTIPVANMDSRTHPFHLQSSHYSSSGGHQSQFQSKASASTLFMSTKEIFVCWKSIASSFQVAESQNFL